MSKQSWWNTACVVCLLGAAGAIAARAQTFTVLHGFGGTNGYAPRAGLVQDTNGSFYGTTSSGGGGDQENGTIFKITPSGTLTTLYNFCSESGCADGAKPVGGVVQATNGKYYGTTEYGGGGDGSVFMISPGGTLTTLYDFCSQSSCTDGASPEAGLVQASDGNFYGTTAGGGTEGGYGTVFEITPGGALTTLHSFDSTDGGGPYAGLVQGTDGNFYGTTSFAGANGFGGTVFKITPSGTLTTLHSFCTHTACTDGEGPEAALVEGADGNFYGTTIAGGTNGPYGTVFKITPGGTLTSLYSFCSQGGSFCTDGYYPSSSLLQATDGSFYGTTYYGGANGDGTVFKIAPSGALTTLYSFCSQSGCADGGDPRAALIQDTNGSFYGTTEYGGPGGGGTVFSLSVGLGPFVETLPASGKAGTRVGILGTDLKGATSVTFNGTAATFTIGSASVINTTVPAGATTGTVQVVTPSGTLTSNVPFRVTQ